MKLNNWKVICAATLILGTYFMVPIKVNADQTSDDQACANTQTASDTTCTTAQATNDAASLLTLKTVALNDATTEQTTVANDAANQANAAAACDLTLYGFIGNPALNPVPGDVGSCGRTRNTQDAAAYAALVTALAGWNGSSCPNPNTGYTFTLAQDAAH